MPVVHCKRAAYDVYVGRPSQFGNPFVVGKHGERGECIELYRAWLEERLTQDAQFAAKVKALHGKTLGCWCSPRACHGDVLLEAAARL